MTYGILEWPDLRDSAYIGRHTGCHSRILLVRGTIANRQTPKLAWVSFVEERKREKGRQVAKIPVQSRAIA